MDAPASISNQESTVSINDLPCEMLLEVFSYLFHGQLLNTIPQVCKLWRKLHNDPTLYRRFTFTQYGPSTADALKLLRVAPWLKSLKMIRRNDANAILECARISNQRLETLTLKDCKGSPVTLAISSMSLLGVLDCCNLLRHLSLHGSHCQSTKVYNEIGRRLPSLRSVDLGKPKRFNPQALLNITDNCPNLEEIQALDFKRYGLENVYSITDHIVSSICNQLRYLKIVQIDFEKCTDLSIFSLALCHQLTTLELHNAIPITDVGIMALSDMPNIMKLTVRYNYQISTRGWLAFFQKPIMRRLLDLRLFLCKNVNQKARDMILKNPYGLRELRLTNSELFCVRYFNPVSH